MSLAEKMVSLCLLSNSYDWFMIDSRFFRYKELEIIENDDNSNELNEESDEDEEYSKLYHQYLKRALPRMGRRSFDQDDIYKRALMRMGRALPRMGRALPRMG